MIYVYDDDFPEKYWSKELRSKVTEITTKCPGCNYGSYPEMTLSARSYSALLERLYLQMKTKSKSLVPLTEEEIMKIFNEVKSKYPIYKEKRIMPLREKKKWPMVPNIPKKLWQTSDPAFKPVVIQNHHSSRSDPLPVEDAEVKTTEIVSKISHPEARPEATESEAVKAEIEFYDAQDAQEK